MTDQTTPTAPSSGAQPRRTVLLVAHTGRDEARSVAVSCVRQLVSHGLVVRVVDEEAEALELADGDGIEVVPAGPHTAVGCELTLVIGGDGTILRAAELVGAAEVPLLGVNLGHVGFLAEAEQEELGVVIEAVVARRYEPEQRMTLDVRVVRDGEVVWSTFALNEASVEKAARERMLEVIVEIDGRPLSRWGCDGVVCATPTGSTAYNFSAGGPVVWPDLQALLVVPLSAHALFARPLVVAPTSVVAVEVLAHTEGAGVLWADGRRTVDLPPGARIELRRGAHPVRLARLHDAPFTDRLVAKFGLPVHGWRGERERGGHGA